MINLIYGAKGSGKTKRIIDSANDYVASSKGSVVYITDRGKHSAQINTAIRFIDSTKFSVACSGCFMGFVSGILASNTDITRIYIDGLARIIGMDITEMESALVALDELSTQCGVDWVLTISTAELPTFMKKYI